MIAERMKETLALLMIGDGVAAVCQPSRHMRLWQSGPESYQAMMTPLVKRPALTRLLGAGEALLGLWWASQQRARRLQ
jgi:hypothetical protein